MTLGARRRLAFGAVVTLALAGHALALAIVGGLLSPPRRLVEQQHAVLWLAAPARSPATSPPPPLPIDAQMQRPEAAPPITPTVRATPAPANAPEVPEEAPEAAVVDAASPSDRPTLTADQMAKYLPASVLTQRALIAEPINLDYRALDANVVRGGSARFIVLISEEGRVDHVVIENSTLNPGFQSFALSRFYGTRFEPGELGGMRVPARAVFEVSDDGR